MTEVAAIFILIGIVALGLIPLFILLRFLKAVDLLEQILAELKYANAQTRNEMEQRYREMMGEIPPKV